MSARKSCHTLEDLLIELEAKSETLRVQKMREVVSRFQVPEGAPEPVGTAKLNYVAEVWDDETRIGKTEALPVANGEARIVMPVPNRIDYGPQGMAGYWFAGKMGVGVEEGDGAFTIDAPVVPAGGGSTGTF